MVGGLSGLRIIIKEQVLLFEHISSTVIFMSLSWHETMTLPDLWIIKKKTCAHIKKKKT